MQHILLATLIALGLGSMAYASDKSDLEATIQTDQELVAKHAAFQEVPTTIIGPLLKELGFDYGAIVVTSVLVIISDPLIEHKNVVLAIFTTGDHQIDAQLIPVEDFKKAFDKVAPPA